MLWTLEQIVSSLAAVLKLHLSVKCKFDYFSISFCSEKFEDTKVVFRSRKATKVRIRHYKKENGKRQTMTHTTEHRILKIEQLEPY